MIKFKKVFPLLLGGAAVVLLLIGIVLNGLLSINTYESNRSTDELIITDTGNGVKIENIQQYFQSNRSAISSVSDGSENNYIIDDLSFNYLRLLGLSDDEINSLSENKVREYESAEYAIVNSTSYDVTETLIDNGEVVLGSKITITTRLLRVPALDTNIRAYRMEAQAFWNKSPSYRLKDVFAINATNGSVYGKASTSARSASMSYTETYSAYGTSKDFYFSDSHSYVEEFSETEPLFAYRYNLPNDVNGIGVSNRCSKIKLNMSVTIYNNNAFNVYSSYGHKYLGGSATVSIKGGNITFNRECTEYKGILLSETKSK